MKQKITSVLGVIAFGAVIALFSAPTASDAAAITINTLSVTVRTTTCVIAGCANPIWGPAAGTNLTSSDTAGPNKSLVLTQTNGFNFDTSEPGNVPCTGANPCATTLNINGTNIAISGAQANALANFNADPGGIAHNEASNWNGA